MAGQVNKAVKMPKVSKRSPFMKLLLEKTRHLKSERDICPHFHRDMVAFRNTKRTVKEIKELVKGVPSVRVYRVINIVGGKNIIIDQK